MFILFTRQYDSKLNPTDEDDSALSFTKQQKENHFYQ